MTTPVRHRLRRRRSTQPADNTGSPVPKKSSPAQVEVSAEDEAGMSDLRRSPVYSSRRQQEGKRLGKSPAELCFHKGEDKLGMMSPEGDREAEQHTPHSIRHLRQHSPDTPFICSQLAGTQECEVVWDCESPGFSKDDLKRMHRDSDDGRDMAAPEVVQVRPSPHRVLFPRTRGRPHLSVSNKSSTAAQLHQLLDLLSKKENESKSEELRIKKLSEEECAAAAAPPSPAGRWPASPLHQPPVPSSQPFHVSKGSNSDDQEDQFNESLWEGELNIGICDISAEIEDTAQPGITAKPVEVGGNISSESKNASGFSADVFDDDLFNDSVLRRTQEVEEALSQRSREDAPVVSEDSQYSPAKTPRRMSPNTLACNPSPPGNTINNQFTSTTLNEGRTVAVAPTNTSPSQVHGGSTLTDLKNLSGEYNPSPVLKNLSGEYSPSPVLGKQNDTHKSNQMHKKKRNSFKLDNSTPDLQAEGSDNKLLNYGPKIAVVNEKTNNNITQNYMKGDKSVNQNKEYPASASQKIFPYHKPVQENKVSGNCTKLYTRNTNNSLPRHLPGASQSLQQRAVLQRVNWDSGRGDRTPSRGMQQSSRGPPSRGMQQSSRGLYVRSHSSNENRQSTSVLLVSKRSNSTEGDYSQEWDDDDEFFQSLLSTLPADEETLLQNMPTQPLSVVGTNEQNLAGNSHTRSRTSNFTSQVSDPVSVINDYKFSTSNSVLMVNNNNNRSVSGNTRSCNTNKYLMNISTAISTSSTASKPAASSCGGSLRLQNSSTSTKTPCTRTGTIVTASHSRLPATTSNQSAFKFRDAMKTSVWPQKQVVTSLGLTGSQSSSRKDESVVGTKTPALASDTFDDDLFNGLDLTLIDQVESQYGTQQQLVAPKLSQPTQSQQCTQDQIALKKKAALRLRQERQQQNLRHNHH